MCFQWILQMEEDEMSLLQFFIALAQLGFKSSGIVSGIVKRACVLKSPLISVKKAMTGRSICTHASSTWSKKSNLRCLFLIKKATDSPRFHLPSTYKRSKSNLRRFKISHAALMKVDQTIAQIGGYSALNSSKIRPDLTYLLLPIRFLQPISF